MQYFIKITAFNIKLETIKATACALQENRRECNLNPLHPLNFGPWQRKNIISSRQIVILQVIRCECPHKLTITFAEFPWDNNALIHIVSLCFELSCAKTGISNNRCIVPDIRFRIGHLPVLV